MIDDTSSVRTMMRAHRVRLYYNRHSAAPCLWSIDYGTQESERTLRTVRWEGISGKTGVDLSVPVGDVDHPRVWIEFRNVILHLTDDEAYIFHDHDWRKPRIEA